MDILISLLVAGAVTVLVAGIHSILNIPSKPKADKKHKEAIDFLWYKIRNSGGTSISTKYSGLTTDEIRKEFEPKGYTVTEDEIKW